MLLHLHFQKGGRGEGYRVYTGFMLTHLFFSITIQREGRSSKALRTPTFFSPKKKEERDRENMKDDKLKKEEMTKVKTANINHGNSFSFLITFGQDLLV